MTLPRLRVLDRVAQRLARDAIRFVADDGVQIARVAIDVDVDRRHIDADGSLVSSAPIAAMPFARSLRSSPTLATPAPRCGLR